MSSKLTEPVSNRDHTEGNIDAPITLVEYGDYQCPGCGQAYPQVKDLLEKLGENIRFVFRNFPLTQLHPYALLGAVAAEAAGLQGKFWEMHDMIYENQIDLSPNGVMDFAEQLGLDMTKFQQDLNNDELQDRIEHDFTTGINSGVNGTPSFYVNGEKYEGPLESNWIQQSSQRTA